MQPRPTPSNEGSPEAKDLALAIDWISNGESGYNPGGAGRFPESGPLSDGKIICTEFHRYETDGNGKVTGVDLSTFEAFLTPAQRSMLAQKLISNGEVRFITGSSDDTLSVRVFLRSPRSGVKKVRPDQFEQVQSQIQGLLREEGASLN
jgi:hypothetical protein